MSETDHRPRAEFFIDEDRRAMRIRIPIHPVFLEKDDKDASTENVTTEENETSFETSLKQADYDKLYIVIQKLTDTELVKTSGSTNDIAYTVIVKI